MTESIVAALEEGARLKRLMAAEHSPRIAAIARRLAVCLASGGKVLFAGNGGSAGDSQHLATELVVRLSPELDRAPLAGLALTTDSSLLTACANDYDFDQVFARQVAALGRPGDTLILLSTSGNSRNLIEAARRGREGDLVLIGLLGGTGGALLEMVDEALVVPSRDPGRVQEVHIAVGHILIGLVEKELF
jgi:D-sedoheptulose 7-phosphate isomerase